MFPSRRMHLKYILIIGRRQTEKITCNVIPPISHSGQGKIVAMENTSDTSVVARTGSGEVIEY